jgi:hypothetical protein
MIRFPVTIEGETVDVGNAAELSAVLDVLNGHFDRAVLEQLRPHLPAIVAGPAGLIAVMRSLVPDDQLFLVEALGGALARVIGEARHLRDLLAIVAEARVRQAIVATLGGDGLRTLVHTPADLAGALEWMYGEGDSSLLDLVGAAALERIVRSGTDLGVVLCALDDRGQARLVDAIGWDRVAGLVTSGRDLAHVLRALPAAMGARLLGEYSRERIVALVGNPADWTYLYERLEPAEADALLARLKG